MKYSKVISLITAMLLITGASSCGKTDKSDADSMLSGLDSAEINGSDNTGTASGSDYSDEKNNTGISKTTTKSEKSESTITTKVGGHNEGEKKPVITTRSGSVSVTATKSPSNGNSVDVGSQHTNNQGGGTSSPSGGSTDDSGSSKPPMGNGSSQSSTQPPAEPTETSEENVYTAEITLGDSPKIKGDNVTADDSIVTISAGGDYYFTGVLPDGQICVDTVTEEKVTLILDNVNIHNSTGPAIFINEAKKCTVKVRDGSVNNLSDETKNKRLDGVIYSNDTIRIKGNGTLNINAGNAHGICSDDDIIIENGIINIKSKKSGLIANDDITISGGTLGIAGGTNGIKSKGTVHVTGGRSVIAGGTKEEKCSIYVAGEFSYTGGWMFAAGNQVYVPTSSANPYIVAAFGSTVPGGTSVEMVLDGVQMVSFAPHCDFRSLLMLSAEISENSSFYTVIGGESSENFTVSGTDNIFEIN